MYMFMSMTKYTRVIYEYVWMKVQHATSPKILRLFWFRLDKVVRETHKNNVSSTETCVGHPMLHITMRT